MSDSQKYHTAIGAAIAPDALQGDQQEPLYMLTYRWQLAEGREYVPNFLEMPYLPVLLGIVFGLPTRYFEQRSSRWLDGIFISEKITGSPVAYRYYLPTFIDGHRSGHFFACNVDNAVVGAYISSVDGLERIGTEETLTIFQYKPPIQ